MTSPSPPSSRPERRLEWTALLLALLSAACLLVLAHLRGSWPAVAGDESTFLAMTESLVLDGDLEFTEDDRSRLEAAREPARKTIILQRVGDRVAYSKPVLYPLTAAPFYALLGRTGLVLFNGAAILAALFGFWTTVRRSRDRGAWTLTVATFAATGAVLPQVAWSMGDALQLALALGGATLCVRGRTSSSGWLGPLVGGALLGCLVGMRLPNAILVAAVVLALAAGGRYRRALAAAAGAAVALVLTLLATGALIGSGNPYRAERATFNLATGYPAGEGRQQALEQFVEGRATQRLGVRPVLRPRMSAYAGLYFLVGRHTGALFYFPVALVLFGAALRQPSRERLILVLGAVGLIGFYLIWLPENYFGGASFVGNRYLLPALALLLPALAKPAKAGWLIGVWVLSALCLYSAFDSVVRQRNRPYSSQSHAYSGLFRVLPYESTALAIEDREDRYFSDEFLRFVDGNAEIGPRGFYLRAGDPPAEILLATPRPSGLLRFLVWVDTPQATLVYSDWRGERRFELASRPQSAGGPVEIVAGPAWRRHPLWWTEGPWRAHAIRLSVEVAGGVEARADVRYLGPYRLVPKFFAYAAGPVELPESVEAGSVSVLRVALTNRGRRPWASDADVPIHLARRLQSLERSSEGPVPIRFTPIRDPVPRHGEVELLAEQRWPRRPGRYRLELDLAVGGVALFQEWVGSPIVEGIVEVVPAQAEATPVVSFD